MIISTLYNHYLAQIKRGNPLYPPQGMELKRVHYVLVISGDGTLLNVEPLEQKINVIKSRPRAGRDAINIPNIMWDSVAYITEHPSFRYMVQEKATEFKENKTLQAVQNFYRKGVEQLLNHPLWGEISSKKGHNLTFRLLGEELLAAQQSELITPSNSIARLHPKLYIVGASGSGAKLVSFTNNCGYNSYGKKNAYNAPMPEAVAQGYAAAITALTQIGGEGNIVIGNVTFLYFDHTIIALVPNMARISVRMHIENCDTDRLKSKELLSSLMLLAPSNDPKRLASQFIVDFVEAVVLDKPLPKQTLPLLLKVKTFHPTHITLLHRYLNIKDMALNRENQNVGYLLGRLLAVVERAQIISTPKTTYTVKDNFYSTFSVNPSALFNRLMSLSLNYF